VSEKHKVTRLADREGWAGTLLPLDDSDVAEEQADWESMHCRLDPTTTCEHEDCVL